MTDRSSLDEKFSHVVAVAAAALQPCGFTQRGPAFRRPQDGNCGIIEFQKSSKSAHDRIIFSINLAVLCGRLLEPGQPPLEKARSAYGHLRKRLGFLLQPPHDKWWEIREETDAAALAAEISDLLCDRGAPYVCRYSDTKALVALWQSGGSPGLTNFQRLRYLAMLGQSETNPA